MRRPLAVGVLMISWIVAGAAVDAESPLLSQPVARLNATQALYLERCGGCHGIQGVSAPNAVPTLRALVGYFLCTAEARSYLIQLPSVALAPISDQSLADLMNFVVFDLGAGRSVAPAAQAFTAAEVNVLRQHPLRDVGLIGYRTRLVESVIERCGASVSLRAYSRQGGGAAEFPLHAGESLRGNARRPLLNEGVHGLRMLRRPGGHGLQRSRHFQ